MARKAVTVGVIGMAAAAAWAQPRMVLIGGGQVADMTPDGSVVVGTASVDLQSQAARWTVGATVSRMLLGGSDATGVSADGTAASGNQLNAGGVGGQPVDALIAARWTLASGAWQDVGVLTPAGNCTGSISTAYDISASGRYVVGGHWVDGLCGGFRAFVYDAQTGVLTNLGGLGGPGSPTRANAVSGDGSVIVGFDSSPEFGSRLPAVWRWNPGTMSYEETLLNTDVGEVYVVNSAGTICAGISNEFPGELVRWTWDGSAWVGEGLGQPAGGPSWAPTYQFETLAVGGMSEDGSVIAGIAQYRDFFFRVRAAFIWTGGAEGTGVPVDLQDYLTALPVPPAGLEAWPSGGLTSAIAVSADGTKILGNPIFVPGAPGAWLIDLAGGSCVAPAVASSPMDATISACSGTLFLNAGFSGAAPFTYQWYKDGAPLTDGDPDGNGSVMQGTTGPQLVITGAAADDAGAYTCAMTNGCGSATTDAAMVTVGEMLVNDTCATASAIGLETVTWSPCGAVVTDGVASCVFESVADAWFRYTPAQSGLIDVSTCGTEGADTVLSVYADGCLGIELACNDNCAVGCDQGFGSSRIERLAVSEGEAVLIRVATSFQPFDGAVLSLTVSASGPTAPNDTCDAAAAVGEGSWAFDTTLATTDTHVSCIPGSGRDVWFRYTPSFTGEARISTCGTVWDTVLSVHGDGCGGEIDCNDDAGFSADCSSTTSVISRLAVTAGQPVLIRVAGSVECEGGVGMLTIGEAPPRPANDVCDAAITVGEGQHAFDLTEAATEMFDGCDDGQFSSTRDVWFRLAPSCGGVYTVETCAGNGFDAMLHVLDACGGSVIACNDNVGEDAVCSFSQSRIAGLTVTPGAPVLVRVSVAGDFAPYDGAGVLTVVRTGALCPVDYDCNGAVNSSDISAFLTAWLASVVAGDLDADFNGDGSTNSSDISAFLTAWLAGVQTGC